MTGKQIDCLGNGFVRLVDVMPRDNADLAICQAARVSYGTGNKTPKEDRDLIRYLMRHRHTSPFEQVEMKFHCKMPIFVARQWVRTRTAKLNERSLRYSEASDEFYIPKVDDVRTQSKTNKQGSDDVVESEIAEVFIEDLKGIAEESYELYEKYIAKGMAKELARIILPLNLMTEWYWKIDCHNLLHFLALRCDSHAQKEIQVYGNAILDLIRPIVPWTIEAWEDYHPLRGAMLLTRLEVEALQDTIYNRHNRLDVFSDGRITGVQIKSDNKRECDEWTSKAAKLGIRI